MKLKVTHERWKCIACAACAAVTDKYWEMNEKDDFADLKGSTPEMVPEGKLETLELETVSDEDKKDLKETSEICPVECIHVEEDPK